MQKYKVFINNDYKIIIDSLESLYETHTLINAAGGVVYNSKNQILMIFRNNKWDLPKGKLEVGESITECAIREVKEECGLARLKILRKLSNTYHTYKLNGILMLKSTCWFEMRTLDAANLIPQHEEGITKVEWVDENDIQEKLENTYGNIKELLFNQ